MKAESLSGYGNIMTQSSLQNYREQKNTDFKSILEGIKPGQDDEKLKAACQEMESIFVYEMLKQMRAAIPKGGLIPEGTGENIYRDMLDEEYSKIIAKSKDSLGLSDLLYQQLKRDMASQKDNGNVIKESE